MLLLLLIFWISRRQLWQGLQGILRINLILLSMSLEERFQKLLCEGPPLQRFSTLKYYALDDPIEDVFRVLQQHALLVQGLWTPKTRLLNLDPALSFGRDYALVLFSKDVKIRSSQLDELGRHKDRVKEILTTLATERRSLEYWKLKEPPDVAFMKQYPEIVKKQEQVWKTMEDIVFSGIRGAKGGAANRKIIRGQKPSVAGKPENTVDSDKGTTKALSGAQTRRTMSDETRKALPKALIKVFQNHKVCSFQQICQGLRDLAVSKSTIPKADSSMEVVAAYGVDAPAEELQEVISQVATNIHGYYVLKSSPEHPLLDPLRKVVIDLLCVKGPDAKLKKADIFTAAKIALNKDITSADYNKVMTDFCESRGSAWVLKRGDVNPK
ncbi:uncharacterized protein LOC110825753 [Carica papaya]|uniref:uncharacterized protein LOC110825753 n=1 Tax=Carica papaya TaxID=3649 RepID=UPI000B8C815E|nr:uncharacterized protein LOC110825753 [Carica papaya]XP_021911955.1 uncharacterized protein LOC110825753 [Carica papaya]